MPFSPESVDPVTGTPSFLFPSGVSSGSVASTVRMRHRLADLDKVVNAHVSYASMIGDRLLLVGWHSDAPAVPGPEAHPAAVRVDAGVLRFPRVIPALVPEGADTSGTGFLCVLDRHAGADTKMFGGLPDAGQHSGLPDDVLLVGLGRVGILLDPDELRRCLVDVRVLAWEGLAGVDAETRARAAAFLAAVVPPPEGLAPPRRRQVARELKVIHDTIREHLPPVVLAPDQPRGVCIDQLFVVDESSFYVRGWARDTEAAITSMVMVSPEGGRTEIASSMLTYPRPDVEEFYGVPAAERAAGRAGFVAFFELPTASRLEGGWMVEVRNAAGVALEASVPAVTDDAAMLRTIVLRDMAYDPTPGHRTFLREHVHPTLSRLQVRRASADAVDLVRQFGTPPEAPDVTVLVPLYKRMDFVEHQLAAFVHDPQLRDVDLVYVLDSPENADELQILAERLSSMYPIPFRIVLLNRNLGFADANNVGATFARGRLLLLLNSDVLPSGPGWLSTMVDAHDTLADAGAVGAKLLYEDDSLQHAGMFFERADPQALWTNGHYFKGLHSTFPPANITRAVPAVTGACLLMDTALYREMGGLAGGFVQGDYEDSDLCLRLLQRGKQIWYVPEATLYHLEGQSYPDETRRAVGRYNTWLQTHLWDADLAEAMARYGTSPGF